ncbi:MAG: phosphoribosylaminoimidazolesuccinocarboxamide synthase [Candidatus Hadarchaeota archaeon]
MKVIYDGKTNTIVEQGKKLLLRFKDTLLGDEQKRVDPGGDVVVGRVPGKGIASAASAARFFEVLKRARVPTHYIRQHSQNELEIRLAEPIRLEVIYRALAYGSFLRRYRGRVQQFSKLDVVEFNMKDDILHDPLINEDVIIRLKIASPNEIRQIKQFARKIYKNVSKDLERHGLTLVDMKLEFGRIQKKLVMIDSLSGDTMRVMDPKSGKILSQLELAEELAKPPG